MQNYFDVVQDQHGNAIPGASVFVYDASGLPATLFSDNGVTPTANPLTTNTDGEYDFFAANGRYSLDIQIAGYAPQNKTGIILFDPEEQNTENFTGDGNQVAFVLPASPQFQNAVSIYINGVYQQKNTFLLASGTVTFSEAPPPTSTIEVVYF
jgi:hypothetical protein